MATRNCNTLKKTAGLTTLLLIGTIPGTMSETETPGGTASETGTPGLMTETSTTGTTGGSASETTTPTP